MVLSGIKSDYPKRRNFFKLCENVEYSARVSKLRETKYRYAIFDLESSTSSWKFDITTTLLIKTPLRVFSYFIKVLNGGLSLNFFKNFQSVYSRLKRYTILPKRTNILNLKPVFIAWTLFLLSRSTFFFSKDIV